MIFLVTAAQFVVALFAGYGMDTPGRKRMWVLCLTAAAVFTGMTYFVEDFRQLTVMRMLASDFAMAELAVSITIVNEQIPARHRGLLYSLVQGGWPLGVFLASGVYLLFGHLGWRLVFLLGVIPGRHGHRRPDVHQGVHPLRSPPGGEGGARGRRRRQGAQAAEK